MPETGCPSRDELFALHNGVLGDAAAERIIAHLSACQDCQAIAEAFDEVRDPLIARLRRSAVRTEHLGEPQCQASVKRAAAMHRRAAWERGQSRPELAQTEETLGTLGEYRLLSKMADGGMGTVYKAEQIHLGQVIVLKKLRRDYGDEDRAVRRFLREMKAIGRLDHPNIVRSTDARKIEGSPVLVTEFVDGVDLSKLVQTCGPLPIADACELIRQAAVGLQYTHEQGLVHRDIKPSNLMLSRSGHVKILDFGIALLRDSDSGGISDLTEPGQTMGTLDYMAPEQWSDTHRVDIRADLYSLGCTLYKLLAGHAPFSGSEYQGTTTKMLAHTRRPPPPISQYRSDVPESLVRVLDRLLAKNPADRYAIPGEVAEALKPFTTGGNLLQLVSKAMGRPERDAEATAAVSADADSAPVGTLSTDSRCESQVAPTTLTEISPSGKPGRRQIATPEPAPTRRGRFLRRLLVVAAIAISILIGGGILLWQIIFRM